MFLCSDLGRCSTLSANYGHPWLSLDLTPSSSTVKTSVLHSEQTRPSPPSTELGQERCYLPSAQSTLLPISDFHCATAGRTTPTNYYQPLTPQQIGLCSFLPTRQSFHPSKSRVDTPMGTQAPIVTYFYIYD